VLREGGPRALLWHALAVVGVRRLTFYERPIDPQPAPATAPGVVVRPLSYADIGPYRELRPDTGSDEVEQRLRRGDRCMTAWRGDRLIAVYWMAMGEAPVPYLGVSVPIQAGAWSAYDVFTAPEERRGGLHDLVRAEAFRLMRGEGGSALVYAVLPENRGGRGLVSRYAPRRLGTVLSIRLGSRRLTRSGVPAGYLGRPRAVLRGRGRPLAFGRWTLS
jgi:hypothetical protein